MTSAPAYVREAAVAGQFYPGSADELDATVRNFLNDADAGNDPASQGVPQGIPKALIAPHAGYVYSGAVAAAAYARLKPARGTITRVVLLGPCHRVAVRGLALSGADAFATPLGQVPVDKDGAAQILDLPGVEVFDATHEMEHSLEVHLPFLQVVLGEFSVVPLVVGEADPSMIADVIETLWGGEETLIVVSSDLSHYLDYDSAQKIDSATCKAIENLDPKAISSNGACGRFPVGGLLEIAKRRGMTVTTLDLRNSGDTAGSKDRVVGYGSWMFQEAPGEAVRPGVPPGNKTGGEARTGTKRKEAPKKRTATVKWDKPEKEAPRKAVRPGVSPGNKTGGEARTGTKKDAAGPGSGPGGEDEEKFSAATRALLDRHGRELLALAAGSIEHGLETGKPLPAGAEGLAAELAEPGASFVTLRRGGKLRGCIGTSEAHRALAADVSDNGFRAAFKDPRFPVLKPEEVDGLILSLSLLSAPSPMTFSGADDFLNALRPDVDGLVIEDNKRRALFLPSVWSQLPEPETFVEHLKVKAGLSKDHWSDTFKAWRFTAEEISDDDLDQPLSIWNRAR